MSKKRIYELELKPLINIGKEKLYIWKEDIGIV